MPFRSLSDEELKETIEQLEDALAKLRALYPDVQGHRLLRSDEGLKEAIAAVEDALARLRALEAAKA